ncbi:hypothetical protein C8035_v002896 [Colletotrichum spinosum]|uniref:HAUS augmin-like complex subunit 1 n=1 Tax=Colletotrichum spinosum TaxID=1347390 RepID=A0A4R8PZ92_9PEZI|nr:hypothetical protein C8035_v002896 [Colletotrichum spinosum]
MSHLTQSTAIFSPSIARIAASTAKDWSFVDAWLVSRFQGRPIPPFERNPDTLKALLVLATLNETVDEERDLVGRAEASALRELSATRRSPGSSAVTADFVSPIEVREKVLTALQDNLTREGTAALTSMATLSCQLSIPYPDVETLGNSMLQCHAQASDLEQIRVRVHVLANHIRQEFATADDILRTLRSDDYKPANDMARHNLDIQRKIKAMAARMPERKDRPTSLDQPPDHPHRTIQQITQQENDYIKLLAQKKGLDSQVDQFSSLPDDVKQARIELEQLRVELQTVTQHRDTRFEGLIERASPHKSR